MGGISGHISAMKSCSICLCDIRMLSGMYGIFLYGRTVDSS